jgi:PPP family 3-phenylpropionic acid transporter
MSSLSKKNFIFSSYYFCNVGLFAFFLAVVPLYLVSKSFTLELIAYHSLVGTFAYMLGGTFALGLIGKTLSPVRLVVGFGALSPLLYLIFLLLNDPWSMIIAWFFFFLVRMGVNTIVDTELIAQTEAGLSRFEKIRLWGSIGFIIFGAIFGYCTEHFGINTCAYIVLFILCFQVYLSFKVINYFTEINVTKNNKINLLEILRNRPMVLLLAATALNWFSHAPLYTYLSIYLEKLNWSPQSITLAWNIGVLSETILFFCFSRIESVISLNKLFSLGMIVMVLRWIILWRSENYYVLMASQSLHAFSFGAVYLCSMRLAHQFSSKNSKSNAQGTLNLLGLGFGSLLGRILISYQAQFISDKMQISELFLFSAACAFFAFLLSLGIRNSTQN